MNKDELICNGTELKSKYKEGEKYKSDEVHYEDGWQINTQSNGSATLDYVSEECIISIERPNTFADSNWDSWVIIIDDEFKNFGDKAINFEDVKQFAKELGVTEEIPVFMESFEDYLAIDFEAWCNDSTNAYATEYIRAN